MVSGFHMRFTYIVGNYSFGVVLCFILFLLLLGLGQMIYGFRDLAGFHSSSMVHGYLVSS